jgi:hypothetical protein
MFEPKAVKRVKTFKKLKETVGALAALDHFNFSIV